ncbi:odorant-binding protein 2a-like [Peromyscus maniculatus bairdii]|uniref:Odorant-binding protein 2a-like n=1 Tax=Peromyscus maniculatus bairdii TaxID=230844 RepID=A0A6I9LE08_PERMB|nr:odorant-binding protein 2a-like [Peromyscus maniculatus bairdii]
MKSLLLTFLLLGLVAVLRAQEVPSDNQEDYSGIWYPKALVHNGSLPSHMIPSKVFPVVVTALEGGDMEAKVTFWKKGQCHELKFVMKKTDEPGRYTTFHGKRSVYVEELSVKDHYIFYCESHQRGKSFGMGKLMGRDSKENPEAVEEFKEFVRRKGLKEENIFVPELSEQCVPESSESD